MRFAHAATRLMCLALVCGCGQADDSADGKKEPAEVAHHVEEQSLNTITLTENAERRLGIQLAKVQLAKVQRKRTFGGEVVIPPGQAILVSAPLAGTLLAPDGAVVPAPGSHLASGQPVFRFRPLLTPERDVLTPAERVRVAQTKTDIATARMEAERQVESTKIQVEAARIAYDRAVVLLENKAGSQRTVDERLANLRLAQEAQATAESRHRFLAEIRLEEGAGQLMDRSITSPVGGVLQSVDAAVGETVTPGEPLFQVVKLDRVWIRVPVYVGQWRQIDTMADAAIAEFGMQSSAMQRTAKYVSAPPSANPDATTIDLFYEITNQDGLLYPGQKLAVTLTMLSSGESLVIPASAVLYDIHGGSWVYQQISPRTYARRRVSVRYFDGREAILAAGSEPGAQVVTYGAVELFGTEFGVGH